MVDIPVGSLILSEPSWFRLRLDEHTISQQHIQHPIWNGLQASLGDPNYGFGHGAEYDKFMANALHCGAQDLGTPDEGAIVHGIFPLGSGFNASCTPNVHAHWNLSTERMEFRTMRNAVAGEELVISYDPRMLLYPKNERRGRIFRRFRFWCNCRTCFNPDPNSDSHREYLRQEIGSPAGTVQEAKRALNIHKEEGLLHFRDTLHYDLYRALARVGDKNAMLSCRDARDWARWSVGGDDQRVRTLTNKLPPQLR